ncbi:mitochondrial carrier [Cystobasidium minutum MCA 4210]|uniref:mitochondrial carrier n=1 Tax=Cystobasidium minutum MCA 4210 TaxID=1397322 RepID=UPI0034CDDC2A|eukprot:jgi/Rhomi1/169063/fgenesh1_kg.3_\
MDSTAGSRASRHPSSARPYYVAPSPEDFIIGGGGGATSAGASGARASSSTTTSIASDLPSTPSLPSRYAAVHDLIDETEFSDVPRSVPGFIRYWASASLLGYASTACVMPFEVGKILLQIQWIPKADVQILNEDSDDEDDVVIEDVIYDVEELSDEDDAQAYFHDLNNTTRGGEGEYRRRGARNGNFQRSSRRRGAGRSPPSEDPSDSNRTLRPPLGAPSLSVTAVRDSSGYIVRRSIFESATKPEWILPFTVTGGVWDMMKAIGRWKGEGWWSLWKGQLTTLIMESLSSAIQPFLYSCLAAALLRDSPFITLPLVHIPSPSKAFAVTVLSHVVTGYLLSPLDLARTRLVAQSAQQRHKKYSGPLDALKQIQEEEGGLRNIYFHSALWVPAILDSTFRSLFHLGIPLFIERRLRITPDSNSIIYGLAEFTFSTASLLFTLPIETVRRRLQVQTRSQVTGHVAGKKSFKTCVETRPTPYYGVVEAVYRILTEETGKLHEYNVEQKPRRPSMSRRTSTASAAGGTASGSASRRGSYRAETMQPSSSSTGHANLSADNIATSHQDTMPGALPDKQEGEASSLPFYTGITQLYRGFSMSLSANLIVLVLGLVAGQEGASTGWTEL